MDYKEANRKLKKEFTLLLKPNGFKAIRSAQGASFVKESEGKRLFFGYGLENYVDEFKTGVFGGISLFAIQEVTNIILKSSPATLNIFKDDYFQDINFRFVIKTDADIAEWMKIVSDFYSQVAEPFYIKYNSVADIDRLLNSDPSKRVPELNDLGAHIITGLISAKLNDNPNYGELKAYYEKEVDAKFQGHFLYDNCKQVINYLDNHSIEELNEITKSTPR